MCTSDLFASEEGCETYRLLRDREDLIQDKRFAEKLWQNFKPYADPDFLIKFQNKDLIAHYWEMYLGAALLDMGIEINLENRPTRGTGPDFLIHSGGRKVWIEAVTCSLGEAGNSNSISDEFSPAECARRRPVEQLALRMSTAFDEKRRQYLRCRKAGWVSEDDYYVIALNDTKLEPYSWLGGLDEIRRVLTPFSDEYIEVDVQTGAVVDHGHDLRYSLKKTTGDVPSAVFCSEKYSFLSGVIYSGVGPVNRHSQVPLGNDFKLIHNHSPISKNPLPFGLIRSNEFVFTTERDDEEVIYRLAEIER